MRKARLKGKGRAYYHCISRIVHGQFLLGADEKEYFQQLMRVVEGFSGVQVLTYALMDNHFHILLEVPEGQVQIDDAELLLRISLLYGMKESSGIAATLAKWRREGRDDIAEELKASYLRRMCDVSEFMKTLKQRYTQWYNRRNGLSGTLWGSRFKSVLVEGAPEALAAVAAYIDLNPVRAGIVTDPKDYRFCGYGEAVGKGGRAKTGIARLIELIEPVWIAEDTLARYRCRLYIGDRGRAISAESVAEVLERDGKLPLHQLLLCRVRYFTDGLVLGGRAFVDAVYEANRDQFPDGRSSGSRPLRHGEWGGLCSVRDLRRAPISPSLA